MSAWVLKWTGSRVDSQGEVQFLRCGDYFAGVKTNYELDVIINSQRVADST